MKQSTILTAILIACFIGPLAMAAPQPSLVGGDNNDWTLNVVYTKPQQITMRLPGYRAPQRFWYIIITMTNTSTIDVPFYPKCDLVTDTFQTIPAWRATKNVVFDKIKKRHRKKYPFLESLETADTRILQGSDQSKDMVIIWPDFDAKARNINLYLAGLSNETVAIDHPTKVDENGSPIKIYLRKTLELKYAIGGDAKLRKRASLVFKEKNWVMR